MKKFKITNTQKDSLPEEFQNGIFEVEHWRDDNTIVFEAEYAEGKTTWYVRKKNVEFLCSCKGKKI